MEQLLREEGTHENRQRTCQAHGVNGRPLKAWNQWYNKRMKELKNLLPKADRERVTKQMERITNTRNRQINHYLHTASKRMIDFLVKEGVGTIIIGKNPLWKQEAGMGKRNNQNFVSIPHARFIDMLTRHQRR